MFDWEHRIALHAMKGNQSSSRGEGEVSWCFDELWREPWVYYRVPAGMILQARVCSATSRLLSSYKGHLRNFLEAGQGNTDASRNEAGDHGSLSSFHNDIGIPVKFQQESIIVTF